MLTMMVIMLYNWTWENEYAPKEVERRSSGELIQEKETRLIRNYGGTTLQRTVRKTFCKVSNDRMGTMMEKEEDISEGQAGFRPNRSCVDYVYTLG